MEIQKIKTCAACGCLAVIIITASGPICKKCLKELYGNPDMPVSILENIGPKLSDASFNISRSAVADTSTIGTMDFYNV